MCGIFFDEEGGGARTLFLEVEGVEGGPWWGCCSAVGHCDMKWFMKYLDINSLQRERDHASPCRCELFTHSITLTSAIVHASCPFVSRMPLRRMMHVVITCT